MGSSTPKIGQIFWSDVCASDADTLKDFTKKSLAGKNTL